MTDDACLLRRYAIENSQEAFARLVERHLDFVYATALRQVGGDVALAKDVAQVVFTALARRAHRLLDRPVLGGWLFRATQFAAIDALRSEQRRRAREQQAHTMHALDEPEPTREIDWEKVRPLIDRAIGGLREKDRDAVVSRFFDGCSLAEVGARLGLSENSARMRVTRALDKLHAELERHGVTSTHAALAAAIAAPATVAAPTGLAASVTLAALASHATTGSAGLALGIMHFMSTTKFVAGAAGVIAILAIGSAIYERAIGRVSTNQLAAARAEQATLRAELTAAERRTQTLEADLAAAQKRQADAPAATTKPAPHSSTTSLPAQLDYALTHPAARAAYLERAALAIKTRYERFFQMAGLSGEQQDRFLRLAMDDAERRLDTLRTKLAAEGLLLDGPVPTPAEIQEMNTQDKQRQREIGQGLRDLLGDRFPLGGQYMATLAERNVSDRLAAQLYFTDAPLTGQQADQLTEILAQAFVNKKSETAASNTMGGQPIPTDLMRLAMLQPAVQAMPWLREAPVMDGMLQRAAGILAPSQLAALKMIQAQQVAELKLTPPRPRREPPEPAEQPSK